MGLIFMKKKADMNYKITQVLQQMNNCYEELARAL